MHNTGHPYYRFLDGHLAYYQIFMALKDQEKTIFTCPFETFIFRRIPFELYDAPTTFQRCTLNIFSYVVENCLVAFKDNLTVFGSSFDKCLDNLENVWKDARKMTCFKLEKYFMTIYWIVLGHAVSSNGIEVNKSKLKSSQI